MRMHDIARSLCDLGAFQAILWKFGASAGQTTKKQIRIRRSRYCMV